MSLWGNISAKMYGIRPVEVGVPKCAAESEEDVSFLVSKVVFGGWQLAGFEVTEAVLQAFRSSLAALLRPLLAGSDRRGRSSQNVPE